MLHPEHTKNSQNSSGKQTSVLIWFLLLQGRTVLISSCTLQSIMKGVRAGTQSGNLEAGTEAETMKEHCLMACSSGSHSVCIFTPLRKDHLPQGGTTLSGLGPSTSNSHQENDPSVLKLQRTEFSKIPKGPGNKIAFRSPEKEYAPIGI